VCLYDGYLLFSDHNKAHLNLEIFNNTTCCGFLKIGSTTEVKVHYATQSGNRLKKYSFSVKEAEGAAITFFCEQEKERDEWIAILKFAVRNTKTLYLDNKTLVLPSLKQFNTKAYHYNDKVHTPSSSIDFPRKSGLLKKTSTGKSSFSISTTKSRFFRLEGGELRYYEDENATPSTLKETISLTEASLQPVVGPATSFVTLLFSSSTSRTMKLEATTARIAQEWRDAFAGEGRWCFEYLLFNFDSSTSTLKFTQLCFVIAC
jgi:hypothetical protein